MQVTPALQAKLGLKYSAKFKGTTASGSKLFAVSELNGTSVGGVALPVLHATVANFPMVRRLSSPINIESGV
jgi:hypothetical protein